MFDAPRAERASVSPVPHSPRLGAGLIRRQPGPAGFLLMQCVCGAVGAAAGWGQPQPQRPHLQVITSKKTKVYKDSSAMPQSTRKRLYGATYCASPEQRLSASKKANFGGGKIYLFAKLPKNLNASKEQGKNLRKYIIPIWDILL